MTTLELKKILIHRISEISDVSFLKALKVILDKKSESSELPLTPEQREEILASKKQIVDGLHIDADELEREVTRWLNTK